MPPTSRANNSDVAFYYPLRAKMFVSFVHDDEQKGTKYWNTCDFLTDDEYLTKSQFVNPEGYQKEKIIEKTAIRATAHLEFELCPWLDVHSNF